VRAIPTGTSVSHGVTDSGQGLPVLRHGVKVSPVASAQRSRASSASAAAASPSTAICTSCTGP
jgi:hypothetical protein